MLCCIVVNMTVFFFFIPKNLYWRSNSAFFISWLLAGYSLTFNFFICKMWIFHYILEESENFISSIQFSCSVMSNSLQPHGLQHARLLCPSPTPGACSNSCPSNRWCHPPSHPRSSPSPPTFKRPSIRVFSNESVLHIRWSKYWSFSFSTGPSNESWELISFRID